jgi:hypothetical protein
VFQRVTQQVLEYLHVPHDVEIPANRQLLLARRNVPDKDLDEISPDHLGSSLDVAAADAPAAPAQSKSATIAAQVVPAALTQQEPPTPSTVAMGPPSPQPDRPPEQK